MTPDADPYRTLGLTRDATLDEVRRAYRRLAKANHPDAAGEAALPRFLAIQAAYDTIAGPGARTRRPGAARPTGPRRAWDADRERTDATYRAYGGRSRRARPTGASGPSTGRPSEERPGADRPPGSRPSRPERPPNKATLGSTSYDGADAEPFEPDWGGASWYGTTSGTYWTLNPKEYADPRKHGPEYQARARRKLRGQDQGDELDPAGPPRPAEPTSAAPESEPIATTGDPTGGAAGDPTGGATGDPTGGATDPRTAGGPLPATHTTSSWWEATAGHATPPEASSARGSRPAGARATGQARAAGQGHDAAARAPGEARRPAPKPAGTRPGANTGTMPESPSDGLAPSLTTDAVLEAIRSWLDDDRPGAIGRVARAVVGWAPIALGIGWVGGEISGCGRFAAACDDAASMSAWVVQIAALVVLLLAGRLARIASLATLATLAAAIPAALLLSATGSPDDVAAGRLALSGLLVIAWVVGLVFGVVREVRASGARRPRPPGVSGPARPVS